MTNHYMFSHAISLSPREWLLPQALPTPHHAYLKNYEGPTESTGLLQARRASIEHSDWLFVLLPEDQPGRGTAEFRGEIL